MKLRIRTPLWATNQMDIFINGKKSAVGKPGTYVLLSRKWQSGDKIQFTLPMGLKASTYSGFDTVSHHNRYAMEYGPILLAVTGKKEAPHIIAGTANLTNNLFPDATKPLHFSVANNADYEFVPYWLLEPNQNFTVFPVVKKDSRSKLENLIKRKLQ
jgi:DUF1680 family protein